jgi:uncharacterized membrane protein YdjX (TVP38/TMEM64 family)
MDPLLWVGIIWLTMSAIVLGAVIAFGLAREKARRRDTESTG